jgi:hypothetical protein
MKYLLVLITLILSACGPNRVKIDYLAKTFCDCRMSDIFVINYSDNINTATITCGDGAQVYISDDDYISECK